jgi:hypothetical protein
MASRSGRRTPVADMTKKQQAALAVKLQQFNEWRMADPDIAETARLILAASKQRSVASLAVAEPDKFEAMYEVAEQMAGEHLKVSKLL